MSDTINVGDRLVSVRVGAKSSFVGTVVEIRKGVSNAITLRDDDGNLWLRAAKDVSRVKE